jgi:hypothetical protein
MSEAGQASLEIATPIQTKAARIGRYYALHDYAEAEAWSDSGKADAEWEETLEAVAEQAQTKAHALEDTMTGERPTTRVDALILAGWARNLAGSIDGDPANPQSEPDLIRLYQTLDNIVRFLEADTGTTLAALGLRAWASAKPEVSPT